MKLEFDLSLYLVTDSTMVPAGKTLAETVDQAIQGGVTIVQLREKSADTGDFIATARTVQSITRKASVPLLINDRIDVALAIDADG
ncbi:thiamine biosynthetic bifunctional enzyme, partial [Coemansia sp. RSA 788]